VINCYGRLAADYVINVNLRFEQFARAMGIYFAKKSFMTMDNISIMCRNLCYVAS